jgi:hypothetical protein
LLFLGKHDQGYYRTLVRYVNRVLAIPALPKKSKVRAAEPIDPSPTGRGLGEGCRVCHDLGPHPTRLFLMLRPIGLALRGASASPRGRGGSRSLLTFCAKPALPRLSILSLALTRPMRMISS